jgi:tetratricopeptide (TPR) repeat protein
MRITVFWLLIGCFLLVVSYCRANAKTDNQIDSLKNIIDTSQADTAKIIALSDLSSAYVNIDVDSARLFSREAMRIAKENDFTFGIAYAYSALGNTEVARDNLDEAIEYYLKSISYYEQGNDYQELPQIYLILGSLYTYQDKMFEALNAFKVALDISKDHDMQKMMEKTYNNLGSIYKNLGKYNEALDCYNEALEIANKLGARDDVYYLYGNLGILHAMLGDKDLAESYFNQTLQIALDQNNKVAEAFAYVSLGDFHIDVKNFAEALKYYKEALAMAKEVDAGYSGPKSLFYANVYSGLGNAHFYMEEYDSAIVYLLKGYDLASETNQTTIAAESADKLSHAFEIKKKLGKALEYSRIHKSLSDSLMNEDIVRKVAEMDMQNKFDKVMAEKEFEQALNDATQKRNKYIYLSIIGGSVSGLVIVLLLLFLQKNKMKSERLKANYLQLEKETLSNDLNYKNKELTTNVMYLLKKNELIHNVSEKLKKSKASFKVENRRVVEDVIRDLEAASKGDIWKEFELRFQEVHNDFYNKLNELFPNLTPNELKLCAFLRLNMSTKDIAAITFLSVNSINIARHRLRKKLNIDKDENLVTFLSGL